MGTHHSGVLDATTILDQFTSHHGEPIPVAVDGMAVHLDGLLCESVERLTRCAASRPMSIGSRAGVIRVIRELCALKKQMADGAVAHHPVGGENISSLTRMAVDEAARVQLFTAFRDRCASLGGRLIEMDRAEAAIDELHAGIAILRQRG